MLHQTIEQPPPLDTDDIWHREARRLSLVKMLKEKGYSEVDFELPIEKLQDLVRTVMHKK